jgi:hypothetical protein
MITNRFTDILDQTKPEFIIENPFENSPSSKKNSTKSSVSMNSKKTKAIALNLELKIDLLFSKLLEISEFL